MNQKTTHDSVRFSPLALALVLFVILGLLALTTHAQTSAPDTVSVTVEDEVGNANPFDHQRNERTDFFNAEGQARSVVRTASGTPEKFAVVRESVPEERAELFSSVRETMWEDLNEQKEIIKAKIKEQQEERIHRREAHTARLSVSAQARLSEYAERMVGKMDTTLNRLLEIADRVGVRLETMEEASVDLSEAKEMLEDVYIRINNTREYVVLVGEVSMETFVSEYPEREREMIRASTLLAKEGIRSVHTALREVVRMVALSTHDTANDESSQTEGNSDVSSM